MVHAAESIINNNNKKKCINYTLLLCKIVHSPKVYKFLAHVLLIMQKVCYHL